MSHFGCPVLWPCTSQYVISDNHNEDNDYSASVKIKYVSPKLRNGHTFQIPEVTEHFVYKSLISLDTTI